MNQRWIKVIGIGEDGLEGLSASSRMLIDQADVIIGGARHLAMIGKGKADQMSWRSPLEDSLAALEKLKGKQVVVLATGDPMCHGIGATLGRYFGYDQLHIIPAIGAFTLAAARMGWALTDPFTECLTLHGHPVEMLSLHLRHAVKLMALSGNGETPAKVAELLCRKGFGDSQITVLSHMGGGDESRICNPAKDWGEEKTPDLNVICIECVAGEEAVCLSRMAGLPDSAFTHDGKMTKREIRAATIALLEPKPGELLWDVGAGCGSVAIEWMRAGGRALAIEDNEKRLTMMAENALNLGTPGLQIITGRAPEALATLPMPAAVFIGGGLTSKGLVDACWGALPKGGRLVANAVTLQGEAGLMEMRKKWGGTMSRQSVARLIEVGPHHGWKPFMQVTQYAVTKPALKKHEKDDGSS